MLEGRVTGLGDERVFTWVGWEQSRHIRLRRCPMLLARLWKICGNFVTSEEAFNFGTSFLFFAHSIFRLFRLDSGSVNPLDGVGKRAVGRNFDSEFSACFHGLRIHEVTDPSYSLLHLVFEVGVVWFLRTQNVATRRYVRLRPYLLIFTN